MMPPITTAEEKALRKMWWKAFLRGLLFRPAPSTDRQLMEFRELIAKYQQQENKV